MSGAEDRDLLAAEYVLGCLDAPDLQHADRLLIEDAAFARTVQAWQERLMPMGALVDPAEPPPELWQRIESATAPQGAKVLGAKVVPLRRMRFWQASTGAAVAIAAALAIFMLVRQPARPLVAVLAPATGGAPVLLATDEGRELRIQPSGAITVPADRDLELWALRDGETRPRSLGVLPVGGQRIAAVLPADTQLMVSQEPKGGSPTGLPTGPVLYSGRLTRVN